MKTVKAVKWVVAAALVCGMGAMLTSQLAKAHSGGVSKRDGCHRDKAAGNMHTHKSGTVKIDGICERRGKITLITREVPKVVQVEKLVEVKTPAEVRIERIEVKSPDVLEFDRKFNQALTRLERSIAAEAARRPRVVEREVKVYSKDPALASAACSNLRSKYLSCEGRWSCDDAGVAKQAIAQGCW